MIKRSLFLTEKIGYPGKADTNLLIKESTRRFPTYAFEAHELFIDNGKVKVKAHKVTVKKNGELSGNETTEIIDLSDSNVITNRLNPPFNMKYIAAMHMLAMIGRKSYMVNGANATITIPEKFIPAALTKFMSPTLFTSDEGQIKDFLKKHKDIVVKPLYEFGGHGVFRIKTGDDNVMSVLRTSLKDNLPVIAQKYIPEVKKGDKRIALIEGEFMGAFNRVPPKGQLQAAVLAGGSFEKTRLTETEKAICKALKPFLIANDVFFCGIDTIGDKITEINVTCPAAFYCLNELYGKPSEKTYWDRLEKKLKALNL